MTSLYWRVPLDAFARRPGAAYMGVTGALWTLAGSVVIWGILRRRSRALPTLRAASASYAAWIWIDRLVLQYQAGTGWIFALVVTVALVAFTMAISLDSHSQAYFGREVH
jgi:hypothetical protein